MKITIPGNGVLPMNVYGHFFTCLSSTAAFELTINSDARRTLSGGQIIGSLQGPSIKSLVFRETSGADCEVEFEVGDEQIQINPQVVAGTINAITNIANNITNCTAALRLQFLKTVTAPGTPEALKGAQTYFRAVRLIARKGLNGKSAAQANTGNVYLGVSAAANEQPIVLAPGDEMTIEPALGVKEDFQTWYVDSDNAGDGVVAIYH